MGHTILTRFRKFIDNLPSYDLRKKKKLKIVKVSLLKIYTLIRNLRYKSNCEKPIKILRKTMKFDPRDRLHRHTIQKQTIS